MKRLSRARLYKRLKSDRPKGRPRGRFNRFEDLKYIITIAERFDLPTKQLIASITEAWRNKTSHCGNLTITCRNTTQDSVTLLITKKEQVILQSPIKVDILRNPDYYIR